MTAHRVLVVVAVLIAAGGSAARATCPGSCPIPGGGSPAQDCWAEFAGDGLRLNYPPFDPAKPAAGREVRCFDGDAACDADGKTDGACTFDVDVCLRNADPAIPACTPADVTAVTVYGTTSNADLAALQTDLNALLPATTNVCTSGRTVRVVLGGPDRNGLRKTKNLSVRLKATTAAGNDSDKVKLVCVPREWPTHGYDRMNRRASATETKLGPANATTLVEKWHLELSTADPGRNRNGVTATPTFMNNTLYVSSWNGKVYAVKPSNGAIKWKYDTGSFGSFGVQSSPTLTADGRVLFGDSKGKVHCLNARTGAVLWSQQVGNTTTDHFWASPQVAGSRVIVGAASHSDNPCTKGKLFGLDLDTGTTLWTLQTVPDKVCTNDTTIACTADTDCDGSPGSCTDARGAGVTATVAVDPTGNTVYMATVGCYTFPSVGDSESVFSVDAATGAVNWKVRTQLGEQFGTPPYHDYGFLNGPLLVDGDDGSGGTRPLVVAGSKDGTLYAYDPAGTPVWTRSLIPAPMFAGFGLFNGAIGWANHRLFAALNEVTDGTWPATNDHFFGFSDLDGSTAWSAQIGTSWGSLAVANGVVVAGTNDTSEVFVHDAATGAHLRTLALPPPPPSQAVATSTSGASIVGGTIYIGYGVFTKTGGVVAYGLP